MMLPTLLIIIFFGPGPPSYSTLAGIRQILHVMTVVGRRLYGTASKTLLKIIYFSFAGIPENFAIHSHENPIVFVSPVSCFFFLISLYNPPFVALLNSPDMKLK